MDKDIRIELRNETQCFQFLQLFGSQFELTAALACPPSCKYKSISDGDCHALIAIGDSRT